MISPSRHPRCPHLLVPQTRASVRRPSPMHYGARTAGQSSTDRSPSLFSRQRRNRLTHPAAPRQATPSYRGRRRQPPTRLHRRWSASRGLPSTNQPRMMRLLTQQRPCSTSRLRSGTQPSTTRWVALCCSTSQWTSISPRTRGWNTHFPLRTAQALLSSCQHLLARPPRRLLLYSASRLHGGTPPSTTSRVAQRC